MTLWNILLVANVMFQVLAGYYSIKNDVKLAIYCLITFLLLGILLVFLEKEMDRK